MSNTLLIHYYTTKFDLCRNRKDESPLMLILYSVPKYPVGAEVHAIKIYSLCLGIYLIAEDVH